MFCPVCSQKQVNDQVKNCSSCGFLLSGVAEVVRNGGKLLSERKLDLSQVPDSPRILGIKQGSLIALVSFFIVYPIVSLVIIITNLDPDLARYLQWLGVGIGVLRTVYAVMFESKYPNNDLSGASRSKSFSSDHP